MHYYKFHISDYRKDTMHLTPIEHYIYRSLIDWYYLDEAPIPNKTQWVIRRLGLGCEMEPNLTHVLNDFFKLTEKGYEHTRINREIIDYNENSKKNRLNGKQGGRPKKTQWVSSGNPKKPKRNPTVTLTNNHKPITNNHKPLDIILSKEQVLSQEQYQNHTDSLISKEHVLSQSSNLKLFVSTKKIVATPQKNLDDETELQKSCRQTWKNYSDAYFNRYKTEPVRNAKVNAQVKDFVKRIGYDESPHIAAWFLEHTDAFYIRGGHGFGSLAKDAEKLRTEWATGRTGSMANRETGRMIAAKSIFKDEHIKHLNKTITIDGEDYEKLK